MRAVIGGSVFGVGGGLGGAGGCRPPEAQSPAPAADTEPVPSTTSRTAPVAVPIASTADDAGAAAALAAPARREPGGVVFAKSLGSVRSAKMAVENDGVVVAASGGGGGAPGPPSGAAPQPRGASLPPQSD